MAELRSGRWTAEIDGDFVVFIIGARLEWRHPVRSLGDLGGRRGMRHMLGYLLAHPEKGLLHHESFGVTTSVQYWRSFAALEAFANDGTDPHLAAWRRYWRRVARSGRSGIWHETYLVRAGEYEAIYGNMPLMGLAAAGRAVPLAEAKSARQRFRAAARTD